MPSGDEVEVVNLRNARVDIAPVLPGSGGHEGERRGRGHLWAVYGGMQTWVFAARSAAEKNEWVLAIDGMFVRGEEGYVG